MLTQVRKLMDEGSLTEYWILYTDRALVCMSVRAGEKVDYMGSV
jgi:hypothetical protein